MSPAMREIQSHLGLLLVDEELVKILGEDGAAHEVEGELFKLKTELQPEITGRELPLKHRFEFRAGDESFVAELSRRDGLMTLECLGSDAHDSRSSDELEEIESLEVIDVDGTPLAYAMSLLVELSVDDQLIASAFREAIASGRSSAIRNARIGYVDEYHRLLCFAFVPQATGGYVIEPLRENEEPKGDL